MLWRLVEWEQGGMQAWISCFPLQSLLMKYFLEVSLQYAIDLFCLKTTAPGFLLEPQVVALDDLWTRLIMKRIKSVAGHKMTRKERERERDERRKERGEREKKRS